jgi:hypothetical protein
LPAGLLSPLGGKRARKLVTMLTESVVFAALSYGIALGVSLLVAAIIKIIFFAVSRRERAQTGTTPGNKV